MALTEGPQHTNSEGSKYRAMFLARRTLGPNGNESDVETFRNDPDAGVGWITAPPKEIQLDGTLAEPDVIIENLASSPDGQGHYWFAYIGKQDGVPGNVYGLGYFNPPSGDPLDQP